MRILFINRMASMARGGGETFDLEISRHLEKLGCETTFLTGLPLFSGARIPLRRARVYSVRTPYLGWFPWDRTRGGWRVRLADFWMFERRAAQWAAARQDQFDVVQVCELPVFIGRWKDKGCRLPVVVRLTAPNFYDSQGTIRRADAVIASGASIVKLNEMQVPNISDIPNAVDCDMFHPYESPFRQKHGIGRDEWIILYVARFQYFKNHEMLVRAFARFAESFPDSRLVLVGSGPREQNVKTLCSELGITGRVLFLGEVPFLELPDIYAAANVKAITSWFESFCFAALEAMAAGLPIVTTDCDWVPRLIDRDRGGIVTPINEPSPFADALLQLRRNPDLSRALGEFNRQKAVREHGWDSSARKLLGVYEKLTGTGK